MENRKKRNSILKVRQTVEAIDETMDNGRPGLPTTNRRVSFQNLKQVKQFDREHGKIIDGTPMKEKITDTLGSDGILTPRGGNMDISDSQSACVTLQLFDGINPTKETVNMSLETITNENIVNGRMLDISKGKTLVYENTVETTTKMTERIFMVPQSDETLKMFNSTICQHKDMDISLDGSAVSAAPKIIKHNVTLNETVPMDLDHSKALDGSYNETLNMFNVSNLGNCAMDITLVQNASFASKPASFSHRRPNETLEMFGSDPPSTLSQLNAIQLTDMKPGVPENPIENDYLMDISVQQGSPVAVNDTMAMFKSPSRKDMSISFDRSAVSAAPEMLKHNVTLNETVPMDLDCSRAAAGSYHETVNMFNVSNLENSAMDITLVQNADFASKPAPFSHRRPNETLEMFESNPPSTLPQLNTIQLADINPGLPENPIENEGLMDISVQQGSPVAVNDTMAMFKSPSKLNMKDKVKILLNPEIISKNETNRTVADDSMEIEETFNLEDRKIVVKQLTLETTSVTEKFPNLQAPPNENSDTVRISRAYQTEEDLENKRAHLNSSAMDVTQFGEDIDILNNLQELQLRPQFAASTEQSLAFHNSRVTVDVSGKLTENEETPKVMMMETMQISTTDPTNTLMEINADDNRTKMEGDNRKVIQVENSERTILEQRMNQTVTEIEKNIQNVQNASVNLSRTAIERQEDIDVENEHSRMLTTSFNLSIHQGISKRRRSLLRESVISRESPRRCIAEKSLLSMNLGTCTTPLNMDELSEQRQNAIKTSEDDDVSLNSSLNKSARDIFTLNIMVRSPRNTSINGKSPATPYSLSHKSPLDSLRSQDSKSPEFELPDFDPSVFNVIYLTPNNGKIIPEAAEFQRLVEDERKKVQLEIEDAVKSGEFFAEHWEILKNKQFSKLTYDEREVVRIAREMAEFRFLELRLKFAKEQRVKSEQKILELEEEIAKMAELKRELENLPAIRAELDELKRRPTFAECQRIRQEYSEMTKLVFEQQMELMRRNYEIALQIREHRATLLRELDEREEILNQLEDKERQNKAEIEKVVKNVMAHMN